jgi:hypothetical protein
MLSRQQHIQKYAQRIDVRSRRYRCAGNLLGSCILRRHRASAFDGERRRGAVFRCRAVLKSRTGRGLLSRVSGQLAQNRSYKMTGLLHLKTGESRLSCIAAGSVRCTRVRGLFSPRSHSRHLLFSLHPLLPNCSKTTLNPVPTVPRLASMTALSGYKYKFVRYLSTTRNRSPVFKYTKFTSNGVRLDFKCSSTP